MAKTATALATIPEEALGEFAVTDYTDRLYKKVYYSIRERQAFLARQQLSGQFDWQAFKEKFTQVFGSPEDRKYSLEQLLEYAAKKFGMSQENLVEANKRSWQRRRAYELKQAQRYSNPDFDSQIPY
jgi:hypothetical protein